MNAAGAGGYFLGGGGLKIKSIQRGTIALAGVGSNTATITAVDVNNAVLRLIGQSQSGGNSGDSCRIALTNSTTITATRSDGTATTTVSWEVVEFIPGAIKSIQRGTIDTSSVNPNTATITSVDTTHAWVDHLGYSCTDTASGSPANWWTRLTLTNGTTVTCQGGADSVTSYQVVELLP
jgi:hypothetical protein